MKYFNLAATSLAAGLVALPVMAQTAGQPKKDSAADQLEEIVVTARKRDETALSVPVAVSAFGPAQIEGYALNSLQDLTTLAPGLMVNETVGGLGGSIYVRGIGTTSASNPSFDQTVSVNVDGVQMSRGSIVRLGQIDMSQVEVLRGPQALFFGKNSPAGVISIRTADPTDEVEVMGRVGYEVAAREKNAEAVLSGPVSDTLGLRLAVAASDMEGWMKNIAGDAAAAANAIKPGIVVGPAHDRGPQRSFYFVRGTAKYDPNEKFELRAKISYSSQQGIGQTRGMKQRIYCPNGTANLSGQAGGNAALAAALAVDDCKVDNHFAVGDINSLNLAGAPAGVDDPSGRMESELALGSLEVNYALADSLKLTSITGYADISEYRYDTYSYAPSDAVGSLDFAGPTDYRQFTQEIRLGTNFRDIPLNGMIGGFFQDSDLRTYTQTISNNVAGDPVNIPGGNIIDHRIGGKAYSAFGQLMWNILDDVELAGGARWSREEKTVKVLRNDVPQSLSPAEVSFNNVSPEATLTWRPTQQLTVYGAYKTGFKSGGFSAPYTSASVIPANADLSYRPEKVDGFEGGLKTALAGKSLRFNLSAYRYNYTDLQVNSLDNSTGLPIIRTTNAAAARVQGLEMDFTWKPPAIAGLDLHGSGNYNHARFRKFLASCYIGQTIAEGCSLGMNAAGTQFQAQDLSGRALSNAPDWTGSLGFAYGWTMTHSDLRMRIGSDAVYKSKYNSHPELAPGAEAPESVVLNANISLSQPDGAWELALIGRNLTDIYRTVEASNVPGTGVASQTGTNRTGGLADLTGNVTRGREILLQVTIRPSF